MDAPPENQSLLRSINTHLLKIKGQEIADIVCKQDVSVVISGDEQKLAYSSFELLSPVYVSVSDEPPHESKIVIDPKLLDFSPLQALRNYRVYVSHEASHIYLSEMRKWKRWYRFDKLRAFIANLIEDYRCNAFLICRYPGFKRDYASYLAHSFLHYKNIQDVPRELRFTLGMVQSVTFGRIKGDDGVLSEMQLQKIEKIKRILEDIKWSCLFEEELVPSAERIFSLISMETMRQAYLDSPDSHLLLISTKGTVVEEASISGEKKGDHFKYDAQQKTQGSDKSDSTLKSKAYEEQIIQEFSDRFDVDLSPSAVEKKLIRDIFGIDIDDQYLDLKERRNEKIRTYFSKRPLDVQIPKEDWDFFYKRRLEVLPEIRKISSDLLLLKQAEDWEENYRTGQNLSHDFLQRLLNNDPHLFKRYIEKESDMKWLILTDVSSSVAAPEVTRLTILLSEVASAIFNSKDFCMCAFSNNFYVVKDFNENYDRLVKARIGGMHSGGTTNICDSIEFCIHRLKKFPSETKILIVITDGEPNTCREKDPVEHTKAAVRRAFSNDIFTIGIGTKDNVNIQRYFTVNFTIHSLSEFPVLFKRVFERMFQA